MVISYVDLIFNITKNLMCTEEESNRLTKLNEWSNNDKRRRSTIADEYNLIIELNEKEKINRHDNKKNLDRV